MSYSRSAQEASPQISITEKTRSSIEFRVTNISRHFANALRRVMIAEIPTLAIETVEIMHNTSSLPDEYIAHRLGLIPFNSEHADEFNYYDGCDCIESGCSKCRVVYRLDVTCKEGSSYTVTTKDLQFVPPSEWDEDSQKSEVYKYHEDVRPVSLFTQKDNPEPEPIIIAKLGPGQHLKLVAFLQKGIGRVHSKWSPVSISAYHQIADIKLKESFFNEMSSEIKQNIVNSCPQHIYKKGRDEKVLIDNIEECTFCNQCIREAEIHGVKDAISIQSRRGQFIFNVEAVGQLLPEKIVEIGFRVLIEKLKKFERDVEEAQNE